MSEITRFNLVAFLASYISRLAPYAGQYGHDKVQHLARALPAASEDDIDLIFLRLVTWTEAGATPSDLARQVATMGPQRTCCHPAS